MTVASDGVGEDIRVYKRNYRTNAKKDCENDKRQPYMTIENTDANWFFGLNGDKIFIDSGTSAGTRGLDVVSLTSKKIIHSTEYNEEVRVAAETLIYYKPSNIKGSRKNCPQAQNGKKKAEALAGHDRQNLI